MSSGITDLCHHTQIYYFKIMDILILEKKLNYVLGMNIT